MTNFLHWRKMTWAMVLWSVYVAAWTVISGSGPALFALWWLAGTIVLGSLWLATQPLFRQGHGLTSRRTSAVASGAHVTDGLDWQTFAADHFPGRRRHDLQALIAYSAARRSRGADARSPEEP